MRSRLKKAKGCGEGPKLARAESCDHPWSVVAAITKEEGPPDRYRGYRVVQPPLSISALVVRNKLSLPPSELNLLPMSSIEKSLPAVRQQGPGQCGIQWSPCRTEKYGEWVLGSWANSGKPCPNLSSTGESRMVYHLPCCWTQPDHLDTWLLQALKRSHAPLPPTHRIKPKLDTQSPPCRPTDLNGSILRYTLPPWKILNHSTRLLLFSFYTVPLLAFRLLLRNFLWNILPLSLPIKLKCHFL